MKHIELTLIKIRRQRRDGYMEAVAYICNEADREALAACALEGGDAVYIRGTLPFPVMDDMKIYVDGLQNPERRRFDVTDGEPDETFAFSWSLLEGIKSIGLSKVTKIQEDAKKAGYETFVDFIQSDDAVAIIEKHLSKKAKEENPLWSDYAYEIRQQVWAVIDSYRLVSWARSQNIPLTADGAVRYSKAWHGKRTQDQIYTYCMEHDCPRPSLVEWVAADPFRLYGYGPELPILEEAACHAVLWYDDNAPARIRTDDPERMSAYASMFFEALAAEGHTACRPECLPAVYEAMARTGRIACPEGSYMGYAVLDAIQRGLCRGVRHWQLIDKTVALAAWEASENEIYISERLREQGRGRWPYTPQRTLAQIAAYDKVSYDDSQKAAIGQCLNPGVHIITGGPGTGKTTTVKGIIRGLESAGEDKIVLCAPTGKAAERLSAATGRPARTIHSLIGKMKDGDYCQHDETNPIDANFFIVDEASMLDSELFADLLHAIRPEASLLLVGDPDQLPAVSPGNVLNDLINSHTIPVSRLDVIHRQGEGHMSIIDNAGKIRDARADLIEDRDFHVIRAKDPAEMLEHVKRLTLKYFRLDDPEKVKILTPTKKDSYPVGVPNLNREIRKLVNPNWDPTGYAVDDPVMFRVNDAARDFYNGDIGRVVEYDRGRLTVKLRKKTIRLTEQDLMDGVVELAYATTIHKSQGSEADIVIVLLPADKKLRTMTTRQLLYVAVTRAKKKVYIIEERSDFSPIAYAISRESKPRITMLKDILAAPAGWYSCEPYDYKGGAYSELITKADEIHEHWVAKIGDLTETEN